MASGKKATIRVGDVFETNNFGPVTVVSYKDSNSIRISFTDGTELVTRASGLKKGSIQHPGKPCARRKNVHLGKGYCDNDDLRQSNPVLFAFWKKILGQCYGSKNIGHTIDPDWHSFSHFYHDLVLTIGFPQIGNGWAISINCSAIGISNTHWSAENVMVIPSDILYAANSGTRSNGNDLPMGVRVSSNNQSVRKSYVVSVGRGQDKYVGIYYSIRDAHAAYKKSKEQMMRELADKYSGRIDQRLYNGLMDFRVGEYHGTD